MLKHLAQSSDFENEVKSGVVLVDFYAEWCGPCRMLAPILEEVAEEYADINVLKVDTDRCGEVAGKFGIYSIPTLLLFRDGQLVNKSVGYMPKNQVKKFIGK